MIGSETRFSREHTSRVESLERRRDLPTAGSGTPTAERIPCLGSRLRGLGCGGKYESSIRTYRERLEDQAQQIEKSKEERRQRYVPKKLSEAKVEEDSEAKEEIIEVQIDYPSLTPDSDDVFIATAPVGLGGAEAQTQADIAPVANGGGIVAIAGIAGIAGLLLLTR